MVTNFPAQSNWLHHALQVRLDRWLRPAALPLERANLAQLARQPDQLPRPVADCPVARKYLELLGALDWDNFPERSDRRPWPGHAPQARAPFVAAFLVKLDQQHVYMSDLRTYLVEHPALVWLLGFGLVPDPAQPCGFAVEASVPSTRRMLKVLRQLDNARLQFLLDSTVQLLRSSLPAEQPFGQTVAVDTKHILAWVQENNPKQYVKARYDKTRQPSGDPDCRLGVKKRRNQAPATTPTTNPKPAGSLALPDLHWGYASGVVATRLPQWGEFVLAELTQTFDRNDVTFFRPLIAQAERRLGFAPPFGALDAAFDAFYVYDYFHQAGGFAAVPLVHRGRHTSRQFDAEGLPLCEAGLSMPLKATFLCQTTEVPHQRGRYACPLCFPAPTGQVCPVDHARWAKGGCLTTMATSPGARLRYQLDRDSQPYKRVYAQRTTAERIFAQALALGIERPRLRNQQAITNHNTLTYILINLRAWQRVQRRLADLPQAEPPSA